jgi:IPT/TIG domain
LISYLKFCSLPFHLRRQNRFSLLLCVSPGTQFTTIGALFNTAFTATDVAVMPGNRNTVATVGYGNGIQLWDVTPTGATPRPLTKALINNVYEGESLAWGDATHLYSNDEGLSPSQIHRFTISATSFAETDTTYLDAVVGRIKYSGGLIFSDSGGVVDPSPIPPDTPRLVGRLLSGGSSAADTSINRAFFLNQNSYDVTSRLISAFNVARLVPDGSLQLDNLDGDAFDLIRWGNNGLAFRTATDFWGSGHGRVIMLRGSFVLPLSSTPNPKPSISTLSPASITFPAANTWVTITGLNFVPGSVALWSGAQRTTQFVNSRSLRVAIPASDLAKPSAAQIIVSNPAPGGGDSVVKILTVK